MPRFYSRALGVLAGRGLRPMPAETAREFAARVGRTVPRWAPAVATLTEGYERVRFGAVPLDAPGLAAVEGALAALAASVAVPPPAER
jgi:hypothetical protein